LRCLWNRTRWQSLAEEEKVTGHASVQVGTRRGVTFGHVEYHEFTTEETKEEGKEAHANLEPFYRSLSEVLGEDVHSNWENHLAVQHFKGDGPVGFNALLFVPRREPCDLFEPKMVRNNFGLFLRRTFALVNSDALVPEWLNLVTGVVEPQKGQLALSQDELQRSYMFRKIKKLVVKKCFEMFAEIVQKKGYPQKFYVEFGRHLKLGPYGDSHLGRMAAELLQPAAAAAVHPSDSALLSGLQLSPAAARGQRRPSEDALRSRGCAALHDVHCVQHPAYHRHWAQARVWRRRLRLCGSQHLPPLFG